MGDNEGTITATLGGVGLGVYDDGGRKVVFRMLDDRSIDGVGVGYMRG